MLHMSSMSSQRRNQRTSRGTTCPSRVGPWLSILLLLMLSACSQLSMAPKGDWYRSYARPADQVWATVLEVLRDEGFVIEEADRERGRIRAEAPGKQIHRRPVLHLEMKQKDGSVIVVEAAAGGGGGGESPAALADLDRIVVSVLDALDRYLRETG